MNHHMIRVYFPYADTKQYLFLEESLQRFGIKTRICLNDGKTYRLPEGNFYWLSERASDEVRELVYEIASQISKASVIVTAGKNIAWIGLESEI